MAWKGPNGHPSIGVKGEERRAKAGKVRKGGKEEERMERGGKEGKERKGWKERKGGK